MRVINRVHSNTANCRTHTSPPFRTGFAELAKVVFAMTDFTNRCATVDMNLTSLAGSQTQCGVSTFASSQLCRTASRANQLSALTRLHFNVVHRCTNRNRTKWQRVTWFNRCIFATDDRRASSNTLRCQNVTALTVSVLNQGDVCTTVRIVLKPLYNTRNSVFVALEVNQAIVLLVTAALMTNRDTAVVIATAVARLLLKKRRERLAFMQVRRLNSYDETAPGRCRFSFMRLPW